MPSCLRTDQTTNSNTIYSMNVCFVYSARAQDWEQIYVVISNETKDLKMIYGPTCFGCKDKDHEDMIWISYWKLRENMLEPGDKLNFSLLAAASLELKVKEIGVEFSIDDPVPHEDMPLTSNREKIVSGRSGDTRIFAYGTLRDTVKSLLNDIGVIWELPSSEFIVFV